MFEKLKTEQELRTKMFESVAEYYHYKFGQEPKFKPGDRIHYAGRVFDEKELMNLVDASLDFWLTEGRFVEEFSANLADFLDIKNVLLVNSGSSANLVAFSTLTSPLLGDLRVKPGDEVITVAASFPTTVNPIIQNNAIPVFIDVDLGTYVPNLEIIKQAIGPKTRAIMIAHTMGIPFEVEKLRQICNENAIWLIEDCCDALGSKLNNKYLGTFGDLSTFSFYPAHHITMGEGGAVVTDNEQLAKIACSFRDWGRDCYCTSGRSNTCGMRFNQQFGNLPFGYDHKYVFSHVGYNLKLTDMQAAVGCAQMEKIDKFIKARQKNWYFLRNSLENYKETLILPESPKNSDPSYFGLVLTVKEDAGFSRNDLISFLEDAKIETRNLFCGNLIRHPAYSNVNYRVWGSLQNTDIIMNNTFFIGVYPGLTSQHLDYVKNTFERFFNLCD